jgi:hypothetical protein
MDLDLSTDKSKVWRMKYDLYYLNEYNSNTRKFLKSKKFLDLRIEDLLKHHNELLEILTKLQFYDYSPDLNKEKIDNPLKVLDFLKDIHNPKFRLESEFVAFDNQYFDTDAFSQERRGMKPVISISISGNPNTSK